MPQASHFFEVFCARDTSSLTAHTPTETIPDTQKPAVPLKSASSHPSFSTLRNRRLLTASGLGCLLAGWLWGFEFPIIKHIWTSSMVLWSGGWCLLLLAMFYGLIDVLGYRRWAFFFVVYGMNAIVAYMAPDLINFDRISNANLAGLARHLGMFSEFLLTRGAVGVLWLGLYYMFRKKTFLRI